MGLPSPLGECLDSYYLGYFKVVSQMTTLQDKLEQILKEFLDAMDYALEAPEEQADDKDWFDRPYKEATQAILTALEAWVTSAKPEKSHVTARYSTSEVDRLAFDLAFDSGVDQYHTKLIASLNSNKGEK